MINICVEYWNVKTMKINIFKKSFSTSHRKMKCIPYIYSIVNCTLKNTLGHYQSNQIILPEMRAFSIKGYDSMHALRLHILESQEIVSKNSRSCGHTGSPHFVRFHFVRFSLCARFGFFQKKFTLCDFLTFPHFVRKLWRIFFIEFWIFWKRF